MASNLNKAFMRAYAKDRSALVEDAPAPAAPAVSKTVATPTLGTPVASQANRAPVAPTETHHAPMAGAPRAATPQPAMEPTVFAGRFAPTQASTGQPASVAHVINSVKPVSPAPSQPARPIASSSPAPSMAPVAQPSDTAPRKATPNVQHVVARNPNQALGNTSAPNAAAMSAAAPSGPAPVRTPAPQPRVVTASPRQNAQPQSTRIEQVKQSDNGDATRVWQRIDAAHQPADTHPTETQDRPTASVSATRTAAPKRMQAAAAAPAPVAPAPALRVDAPASPSARQLPLVGDEAGAPHESQQSESRRRTVADFLYSAGQYTPGRILASADHANAGPMSTVAATASPAAPTRASEMVRPMDRHIEDSMAHDQTMSSLPISAPASAPSHSYASPAIEEPMPRRMGQILRVDVPRNHIATAPATTSTSSQSTNTFSADEQRAAMQAAAMQAAPMQPAPMQQMQATAQPMPSPTTDAPVAKYVLEQRRMDRAHKLNEVEEKLRSNTHKIFNPVWEVDNLQWPAVVDKLMQQRAHSMAHVAEHLKTACQDGLSVLGVTSSQHGEGRTTVACCLARLAAAHGLNVALVDIDLDHPTLCVQTNMEVEYDWRDCFSEDVSLEEVAVHSIDDQLTVLPLKPRGGRPGLLASDSRIADILNDLAECFELVIVDCSKTNSSGNIITGLAHTKIFDAAIVVVDRRDGQADRVEDAVRIIQQTGIESIGIVDNFSM